MAINNPLPRDTRSRLADWVEVLSLVSSRGVATQADYLKLHDFLEADSHFIEVDDETGDMLETEILGEELSELSGDVLDELEYRANVLSDYYPFEVDKRDRGWRVRIAHEICDPQMSIAQSFYLFCLLICAVRDGRIECVDALKHQMSRLFQKISAEAAAELLGGEVVSFGWPRPEGTAFQPALHCVSRQLGLGDPLDKVPLWSNGQEKDAGIDVIAWREFADKRPGKLVLLGQVASGLNWTEKTVKADTPRFLSWFSRRPTEHFIPAIFIPFPQHHDCTGRDGHSFEDVANDEAWLREQEFGLVIDRMRIVGAAAKRFDVYREAGEEPVLTTVNDWIKEMLVAAKVEIDAAHP